MFTPEKKMLKELTGPRDPQAEACYYDAEEEIVSNTLSLCVALRKAAYLKGRAIRRLGLPLPATKIVSSSPKKVPTWQPGGIDVASATFSKSQHVTGTTTLEYGWQFRFKVSGPEDLRSEVRDRIFPYSGIAFHNIVTDTIIGSQSSERWYGIDVFEGPDRVVQPSDKVKDLALEAMILGHREVGNPTERQRMHDYLDYQLERSDSMYGPTFPEVEWFTPTASKETQMHCLALTSIAMKELGVEQIF